MKWDLLTTGQQVLNMEIGDILVIDRHQPGFSFNLSWSAIGLWYTPDRMNQFLSLFGQGLLFGKP
jgi:hypothetical protein